MGYGFNTADQETENQPDTKTSEPSEVSKGDEKVSEPVACEKRKIQAEPPSEFTCVDRSSFFEIGNIFLN